MKEYLKKKLEDIRYQDIKMYSHFVGQLTEKKDIKLFKYWTNIDEPSENYFALVYKDVVIKVILRKKVIENTVTWDLVGAVIPQNSSITKEMVLAELREALKVYGLSGYMFVKRTVETEIIVNF